jgi:hypothetical protein
VLTFLFREMPDLIEAGYVYLCDADVDGAHIGNPPVGGFVQTAVNRGLAQRGPPARQLGFADE